MSGMRQTAATWFMKLLGGLDFRSVLVTVTGSILLVLYLYHCKPGHFTVTMPSVAVWVPRKWLPMASFVYSHLASVIVLMAVPLMLNAIILRESPRNWGWRITGTRREFLIVLGIYLAFLPLLIYVAQTPAFQAKYPKLKIIRDSASLFLMYQGFYLLKWISWEFFFRGYLLFGLEKRYGQGAILFSTMPFVVAHLGKPEGEAMGAVIAGLVLGRIALSSRSIFPGVLLHFMVAGTMDFLTSSWWR